MFRLLRWVLVVALMSAPVWAQTQYPILSPLGGNEIIKLVTNNAGVPVQGVYTTTSAIGGTGSSGMATDAHNATSPALNNLIAAAATTKGIYGSTRVVTSGATDTFAATDCGARVSYITGGAVTATIPASISSATTTCNIYVSEDAASTVVTIAGGAGVTVNPSSPATTGVGSMLGISLLTISGTPTANVGPTSAVSSVTNSDSSLTISPTTGAVVASLNPAHANSWSALQTFGGSNPNSDSENVTIVNTNSGGSATAELCFQNNNGDCQGLIKQHSTGGTAFMYISGGAGIQLGGAQNYGFQIDGSGNATFINSKIINLGTPSGAGTLTKVVCIDNSNNLGYGVSTTACTASAMWTKQFHRWLVDAEVPGVGNFDSLRPAVYNHKGNHGPKWEEVGLFADDVVAMDPRCAVNDDDGRLLTYDQGCLNAHLVLKLKDQQQEIDTLKRKVDILIGMVASRPGVEGARYEAR